ncbi:Bleomycin resistance protein [Ligilactobacillus acidipiscis]|jgi:extradiol dioxygenase family protein|uniref:Bleomycin resistance protein n=3 Tax=Ligilactobacillus TaxID=2767887 RepID=A0A0R2XIK7_9LACO|nr:MULTISPECIES: VOC family protein [Ligilactobacillus]HIZ96889.1 VOC family protein [Candidatus Ligilactobacillus excrementavium]KRK09070.1 hypothetical protein FD11_GL001388 [Ligilactobacillus pobuzihii E100301 = KCTC 13174]KRN79705.1 hypothetical protein IV43_GL000418 [Ligilactobacillus acidipiscis]KRP35910.1 hypothetical protein IV66_GL001375 [Ligilactobacillus pobuzihii]MBN7273580.1 VOC family protein [Ligilactobacillus pobuzihii]
MNFNKTIPELSVFDINKSKNFYLNVLGAKIEYERQEDKFVFLSLEENQLMLEEIHDNGWNIGELTYPLGQGINISLEIKNVDSIYQRVKEHNITLYRDMKISHYTGANEIIKQKEFLLQDPNGYLLRLTN